MYNAAPIAGKNRKNQGEGLLLAGATKKEATGKKGRRLLTDCC